MRHDGCARAADVLYHADADCAGFRHDGAGGVMPDFICRVVLNVPTSVVRCNGIDGGHVQFEAFISLQVTGSWSLCVLRAIFCRE